MLTAIRSALLCSEVQLDDAGRANLVDIWSDTIVTDSQPGALNPHVFVQVETDGQATQGQLRVTFGAFDLSVPFHVPACRRTSVIALPVFIVASRAGDLAVTVSGATCVERSFRFTWTVEIGKGAPRLTDAEVAAVRQDYAKAQALILRGLHNPGAVRQVQ